MQRNQKEDDKFLIAEQDYMRQVYKRVLLLAALMHCIYIFVFGWLNIEVLTVYNMFSFLFYLVCFFFGNKASVKLCLTLIHLEVIVFVSVTTVTLGWTMGFQLFLISALSLVYFCPFRTKYIIYIFSITELIILVILKIYTTFSVQFEFVIDERIQTGIYIVNAVGSCAIMLYSAFVSNVSATVTKNELIIENKNLSNLANYDPLTELLNRRSVKSLFKKVYQENKKEQKPFTVLMGDIDDFKTVNDTYGHVCGDYILKEIALMMKDMASGFGEVCRWGGEEFIVIFYDSLKEDIYKLVQKFVKDVEKKNFIYEDNNISITITVGMCDSSEVSEIDEILRQADKRMYLGKHRGKNCIISSDK